MASYNAVINVSVSGQAALDKLEGSARSIQTLIQGIKQQKDIFNQAVGTEKTRELKKNLENLVNSFALAQDGARQFEVTIGGKTQKVNMYSKTLAGLNSQLGTFRSITDNAVVGTDRFVNSLIAANKISNELARTQARAMTAGTGVTGTPKNVQEVIALGKAIPNTIEGLTFYKGKLEELLATLKLTSNEFRAVEEASAAVDARLGSARLTGQTSKIAPAAGPASRIDTVASYEKRSAYAQKIADLEYKQLTAGQQIVKAKLTETQQEELQNRLGQASEALAKGDLALAQRLTVELRNQRILYERINRDREALMRPTSMVAGANLPVRGGKDIIGSPINLQEGTKATVALAQQKQQALADELAELQKGTKAAVSLAQQKQKAAADELQALQGGTKAAVALAQQKLKAAEDELTALQQGTKAAVALAQQKEKAAADELAALQAGTTAAVSLGQQKLKATGSEQVVDNQKRVNNVLTSTQVLREKALQYQTKGLNLELQLSALTRVENSLRANGLNLTKQELDAIDIELNGLRNKLKLEKAVLDTQKAQAKVQETTDKTTEKQNKARTGAVQNALIGGAFPLLFGGGVGAVAGGFAGGFIPGSPMMSIVTSALGTVLDQFAAAAAEMGASLRDPITNFEKLKEANLLASKSQEFYIQKLIETGRIAEATGALQAQIIKKIGVSGYNDLTTLGNASSNLSKAWADFNLQLQAAVAGPLAGLLAWLTEVVRLSTASTQQQAERLDPAAFTEAQMEAIRKTSTLGFGGNAQAYNKELDRLSAEIVERNVAKIKPAKTTSSQDLNTIEEGIKAAEQQADIIKDAYRTGFRLQQQAIDLQRQGTDLQRRVADDIFNKQQQIARLQIDTERQRQQIAIETVDLEYRRRISQEEGRVAEALAAETELLRTRAQGEADIESAKRLLELDIAKQRRDTENYVYQLGRDIENIRRATLNYEMEVADYRLDIERKVAAERRIENAGEVSVVTGGKAGVTATTVAGFPITSRQGMRRKHPVTGGQKMHAGTDIGTPMNTALAYSVGGVVTKATTMGGYGKVLEVQLENGVTAFAAHLNSVLVQVGEKFGPKQLLARTGQTGVGTGPHLHMEGTRGGDSTAPLPYLVLDGKASKVAAASKSSTASQLTTAESRVTDRQRVPMVDAGAVGATQIALDAKDAAIRKEAVTLQEKLTKLQEAAALQRLEEVARGPIDLQQRRDAVQYAKEDLAVVQAGNSNLQERLAFEAQSNVKLQIRADRDKEILQNTKLQGEERKKLEEALQKGLEITQQQIELDREALRLAQEKRFALEEANIQSQLGVTGTGLQAGFVGAAGSAFENEMLRSGDTEQATRLAELTNQLTLAQVQARGMESSVLAIGDAFGTAMTSGVASLVDGTASAQQVFADFLNTIANALMKAAAEMIATYVAIGIARLFAGMGGGGGGNAATALGSNANVAAYSDTGIGDIGIGTFGGFKANGGPVSAGQMYMVGERGPELFVPGRSGTIVPNDKMGSGGGMSVVVNVDASGSNVEGDAEDSKQLGRVIAAAIQQELVKQKRPGGLLA